MLLPALLGLPFQPWALQPAKPMSATVHGLCAPVSVSLYATAVMLLVQLGLQLLLMLVYGPEVVTQLEVTRGLTTLASSVWSLCKATTLSGSSYKLTHMPCTLAVLSTK